MFVSLLAIGLIINTSVPSELTPLRGIRVAILATDGFEQSELFEPKKALDAAGAKSSVVSLKPGKIKGWKDKNWGEEIEVTITLDKAKTSEFDALLLPGGVMNPDILRMDPLAINFIKEMAAAKKPIAAICHAPWLLVEADIVRGRQLTSWASIKTDIKNAGGDWTDRPVVVDQGIITSRKPDDIPIFNQKMIELFSVKRE